MSITFSSKVREDAVTSVLTIVRRLSVVTVGNTHSILTFTHASTSPVTRSRTTLRGALSHAQL